MKKLIAILSLFLCFWLLTGCSDALVKKQIGKSSIKSHETENIKTEEKVEVVKKETTSNLDKHEEKTDTPENLDNNIEESEYSETDILVKEIVIDEETQPEVVVRESNEVEAKIEASEDISCNESIGIIDEVSNYTKKTLLASGRTAFNPAQSNRSSNLRLAAKHINGVMLKPGEEFSFNTVVGRRTTERGFLPADVFSGNSVVKGIGGGICQTSTTLCIAVKQTAMKILEQNPHSMRVTYASYEDEAMINYGTSDFRFQNTYDFPIVIEFNFEQNSEREIIVCDIYALE